MSNGSKAAILRTVAKMLALDLYAAAGYGRMRARIDVEEFGSELRSVVRRWGAIHKNLKTRKGVVP